MNEQELLFFNKTGIRFDVYVKNTKYSHLNHINKYKIKTKDTEDILQDYYMHLLRIINVFDASRSTINTFGYMVMGTFLKQILTTEGNKKLKRDDNFELVNIVDENEYDEEVDEKYIIILKILDEKISKDNAFYFKEKYINFKPLKQIAEENNLNLNTLKSNLRYTGMKIEKIYNNYYKKDENSKK